MKTYGSLYKGLFQKQEGQKIKTTHKNAIHQKTMYGKGLEMLVLIEIERTGIKNYLLELFWPIIALWCIFDQKVSNATDLESNLNKHSFLLFQFVVW